ncbi:tetratricopeptide repeat protein [Neisseriaceae bacterium TC5R-5]|nr:tetratricopeptide repeat protein [Neisseriaceae bacterium TC5R-5]
MRMKTLTPLLPLLMVLLLSACSSLKAPESEIATNTNNEAVASNTPQEAHLPKISLEPDIFYSIIASEIAAQRGAVGAAARSYLTLAKQTRDPRMAQRATEFAMFAGMPNETSNALALWLELEPDSIPAQEQLFITVLRAGKLTENTTLIENLLQRDAERAPAIFIQLARLSSRQTDKSTASSFIQQLTSRYSNLPEARFALLVYAAELGEQATVDSEFDRLAQLAPTWDLPVMWQLDRLYKTNPEQAITFLQRELARRPKASLDLRMAYPRLLVATKHFSEAGNAFDMLLKTDPNNPEILYASGLIAYERQDLSKADQYLRQALANNHPETNFIHFTLGQIAEERHDLANARKFYERVGASPQFLTAQSRLATLDAADGKLDSALHRLNHLASNDEERVSLTLLQSQLAREAKAYSKAHKLLSQALQKQPKSSELLYERALVSDSLGQPVQAERDLKLLLKQQPNHIQALNALGYTLINKTNRYREGLSYIERALKQEPNNPMILDSQGWAQFKLGQFESASKTLQKAYDLLPDPEVAAHLGEVLWRQGQTVEALAIWNKALSENNSHEVLNETMQRLGAKP